MHKSSVSFFKVHLRQACAVQHFSLQGKKILPKFLKWRIVKNSKTTYCLFEDYNSSQAHYDIVRRKEDTFLTNQTLDKVWREKEMEDNISWFITSPFLPWNVLPDSVNTNKQITGYTHEFLFDGCFCFPLLSHPALQVTYPVANYLTLLASAGDN